MKLTNAKQGSTKQHLVMLDLVRFLAAVMVMIYHLCFWRNGDIPLLASDTNNFWWFGWVGVQIFFVLSGYVIAFSASITTPVKFAKSRFLRLIPMVWTCASITLLFTILLGSGLTVELVTHYIFTLLIYPLGVHVDVVYWTLTVELMFYLAVFFTLRLSSFSTLVPLMLLIGTFSIVFNLIVISLETNVLDIQLNLFTHWVLKLHHMRTANLLLLQHGIFFSLGVLLWYLAVKEDSHFSLKAFTVLLAVVCTLSVENSARTYMLEKHINFVYLWSPVIVWLAGLIMIFMADACSSIKAINTHVGRAIFKYLGLITFPLYLLHNNIGLILISSLKMGFLTNALATLAAIACVLIAAVVLAVIEPLIHSLFKHAWELIMGKLKCTKTYLVVFG
jgi:peptidoglycan/LPS O-acetylase OafA/YrhL